VTWTVRYGYQGKSSRRFETFEEARSFARQKLAEPYQRGVSVWLGETWREHEADQYMAELAR